MNEVMTNEALTAVRIRELWDTLRSAQWGNETHKTFRLQADTVVTGLSMSKDGAVGLFVESNHSDVSSAFNYLKTVVYRKGNAQGRFLIYLELSDPELEETFATFCEHFFAQAQKLTSPTDGAAFLEESLEMWRRLLKRRHAKLTREEIRGLWCELDVLEELIKKHGASAVAMWTGPGAGDVEDIERTHDFALEQGLLEVKSQYRRAGEVVISSLDQLDVPPGVNLQLLVVSIADDDLIGRSLRQKIAGLRNLLADVAGENREPLEEFDKKLEEVGWNPDDKDKSLDHPYLRTGRMGYDADNLAFPALRRSRIDPTIQKATYRLATAGIKEFAEPIIL